MSAKTGNTTGRDVLLRDKRAQAIAAMGLVSREGNAFRVTTPALRGRRTSYDVWRDDAGRVRCSCLEFEEHAVENPAFRCEHILAVKHAVVAKNTERTPDVRPGAGADDQSRTAGLEEMTHDNDANASEKRETAETLKEAESEAPRSVREGAESRDTKREPEIETGPVVSNIRPLAKHSEIEEQTMTKRKDETVNAAALEFEQPGVESPQQKAAPAEPIAAVVPLAFTNTLRSLKQQVDPNMVKTREGWVDRQGKTHMVEYVEWHTVADILDRVAPTWQHAVRDVKQISDMVAVTAAITIDGVTREGVGTGTAESEMGIKKAEHDALKRAAVKFGIARELYQRESEVIEKQGAAPEAGEFPRDPLAKSMSDLVTAKQLGMIRALAREAGIDVEEECQSVLRCKTDELSKRAASSFIDHLKNLRREENANVRRAS